MLSTTQNVGLPAWLMAACLLLALACVGEPRAAEFAITSVTLDATDIDGETCVQQTRTIIVDEQQEQIPDPVNQEDNTGNQIGFSVYVPLFFGLLDLLMLYRRDEGPVGRLHRTRAEWLGLWRVRGILRGYTLRRGLARLGSCLPKTR